MEYALEATCACATSSRSIPKWLATSVAVGARPNCWANSSCAFFSCALSSLSLREPSPTSRDRGSIGVPRP